MNHAVVAEPNAYMINGALRREINQIAGLQVSTFDMIWNRGILLVGVTADGHTGDAVAQLSEPATIEATRRSAAPKIRNIHQRSRDVEHGGGVLARERLCAS